MMPPKRPPIRPDEQLHSSVRPEGPGDDTAPVAPEPPSRTGAMKDVKLPAKLKQPAKPAPKPPVKPPKRATRRRAK